MRMRGEVQATNAICQPPTASRSGRSSAASAALGTFSVSFARRVVVGQRCSVGTPRSIDVIPRCRPLQCIICAPVRDIVASSSARSARSCEEDEEDEGGGGGGEEEKT